MRLRPDALVGRSFERFAFERLVDRMSAANIAKPRAVTRLSTPHVNAR